jgi:DNA polymerase III delta prime subunit
MKIASALWVEKYRPKTLDDVVLPERYMFDFKKSIERQEMNNWLFSGPAGGGKTTLARILTSKQGILHNRKDNLLTVNGSAQSTRGIGYVENVIEPFLKIPPALDKYKVVFIDEADNLTPDSYKSLRGIIEKYQIHYGRFIMTCNYVSVIPEPVRSRFTHYIFKQIPKEFAVSYAQEILLAENIEYEEKDIVFMVDQLYPDIRQIIDSLQRFSKKNPKDKNKAGRLDVNEGAITTNEKKILASILEIVTFIASDQNNKIGRPVASIVEILKGEDLEYRSLYTQLFYMEKFPIQAKVIVNKYSNSHQNALIPSMHFMAMVFEIVKSLQDYKKAVTGK